MEMNTRRFEMGLPLFSGMALGTLLAAQGKVEAGQSALLAHAKAKQEAVAAGRAFTTPDPDMTGVAEGIQEVVDTLGATGKLRTIRQLSALWKATDLELQIAESDPKTMAQMVEAAAARPFAETFADAMAFHAALWASLGLSAASSETQTTAPSKAKGKRAGSPSAG